MQGLKKQFARPNGTGKLRVFYILGGHPGVKLHVTFERAKLAYP